ncbi:MAG TPA: RidA family protein [Gemmatimonadaceae bacterium]|nr:RidA family protein [Gemmatimonadaceae bacterium]
MRYLTALGLLIGTTVSAQAPTSVTFTGSPRSPISSNVAIPANKAYFWTSGTVPSVADSTAPAGSPQRFGDTKTQGISILRTIESQLKEKGLTMKDVVYLRVYVVSDKNKGNAFDYQGWFDAYAQFFGTATNPTKPSRSTVGVASLVSPEWLIEIEAFAVYP